MKQSVFILLLVTVSVVARGQHKIENGILDLRYEGIPERPFELSGEWEFYWQKHILPAEFESDKSLKPDLMGKVPSYWTEYKKDLPEIEPNGFATYRLRIIIPDRFRNEFKIRVPVFDSSYRLYINGKYVNSNGVAGASEETSKPGYEPFEYSFTSLNDTIEIVVNVSNFFHRRGGFWTPMMFGTHERMEIELKRNSLFSAGSNGMLIAFAGFFFLFYLLFREDRSMLYFSLASVSIFIRTLFTGNYDIIYFFDIKWTWLIRIEYISSFLALIFAMWYFYYIYRDKFVPWINTSLSALLVVAILLVLSTPVSFFSYTVLFYMPITLIVIGYYLFRSISSAIREGGYNILIAVGFVALMIGALNDMLHASSIKLISTEYILSHTLVFFILMQVIILIYRWLLSSRKEKSLIEEIDNVNKNLENIVIERTSELTNQKGELENQKRETDIKNIELEKTISVKDRIFSIIAHDLKSPVLNLSMMIEHLKSNNDPEVQSSVINSITQQAGFATNLIDNLLLWGEGQRNQINYKPTNVNLTDLILENFNLMKENADRKRIKLTYSHKGDPVAICDTNLTNIILRNIISNSIKFTPVSGNISVSVEEPDIKDGMVYIKVKDNGIGMPPEKIERIMNSEIVDSSPGTENEKGTGLGLQLCNDLIRINKGSMAIKSESNRGTTITIMLPAPMQIKGKNRGLTDPGQLI